MYDHAVVHYSEIGTKSGNRAFFEKTLARNVARALAPWAHVQVTRQTGRLVFPLDGIEESDLAAALAAAARQPGVAWVAPARRTAPTIEAVTEVAVELARDQAGSFKVQARRSEKTLPFVSHDVNVAVGAAIQQATGRPVDVHTPDEEFHVEFDARRGFVYAGRVNGPGGLPVGVSGNVVALMSGGIDSPVAAHRMMLRGCRVIAVHLWNRSFSGEGIRDKMLAIGAALAPHQNGLELQMVPFDGIQQEIVAAAPADLRMLLYRRAMLRVAGRVRTEVKGLGTVVGDSVGQVASQTLQNLAAVYEAATPPVLAPLIGTDKHTTIRMAQEIGTFGPSIRPAEDCCGLLVAKHPRTAASVEMLHECERHYDLDALATDALERREVHRL